MSLSAKEKSKAEKCPRKRWVFEGVWFPIFKGRSGKAWLSYGRCGEINYVANWGKAVPAARPASAKALRQECAQCV